MIYLIVVQMMFMLLKMMSGKQILLPGIPDVIKEIDLAQEKIIVHLLKGLI